MALIEFSQFTNGSALQIGDTVVGLRGGVNTKFTFSAVLSITGTANQITVSGTTAAIIGLASNAIFPGSAGVTLPGGNTAARAGGAGTIRFNSQTTELEATLDGATWVTLATTGGTVLSVSGTANRITSTGGVNPVIDIAATYVGQTSLTTLGIVTTGTWNAGVVAGQYGGTGVANTGKTITIGGNFSMVGGFTFAGTLTGNTAVTFPTSGTLATTAGASIPALVQGDMLYASAANVLSALAKDTGSTRYLSNTGTSNNPAWAQVSLTTGVTGILPGTNGGTGVNNGASLITVGANFTMSGAFTFVGTLTGATTVTFPTSGTLATTGGASIPTIAQGDLLYGSASNVLSTLTKDTNATRYLSNTGASNNPAWSQVDLTNGVTGILPGANGGTGVNNGASLITIGGNVTFSGGFTFTGTITGNTSVTFPTSGTLATTGGASIPSVSQGDLLYGSASNVLSTLAKDTNATRYLSNTGASNNPAWAQINLANGVTGTLPATNGGTGQSTYVTGDTLYSSAANTLSKLSGNTTVVKQYLSQTGDGVNSAAPVWATIAGGDITGAALTKTDDTNVTLTLGGTPTTALLRAASITAGWTGQLALTRGGTNASLTADNGGIVYSTASALAILASTATARQMLQSGASTTPAWSTTTWPATTTANRILYSSATSVIGEITSANSAVLVTNSTGVPAFSGTMTNGQLIIGSTGATPVAASLTAGSGITITPGAGSITITASGSSGAWTKIGSAAVASNSATIAFTGLTATYMMYMVVIDRALPVSDGVAFQWQASTDNGSTYYTTNEYSYANMIPWSTDGSYNCRGGTGTAACLLTGGDSSYYVGNATNEGITGQFFINNPSATSYGRSTGTFSYTEPGGALRHSTHAGMVAVAADIDAIRFLFSSGNISSGIFTLYGLAA